MDVSGIVTQQIIFFATVLVVGFAATKTKLLSSETVDNIQKFMQTDRLCKRKAYGSETA